MISLIILLLLIFGFFMGLKRGFILQLMHLTGFIIAFIVAAFYYKKLSVHLSLWIPYPDIGDSTIWAIFNSTMPLESAFYNGIAFILIFFVTKIVLQIIASMLDFLARMPVLRPINKLLGSILGFLEVYLILFVLLFVLALAPIGKVQAKLDGSFMAKLIIEKTPFLTNGIESLWFTEILSKIA